VLHQLAVTDTSKKDVYRRSPSILPIRYKPGRPVTRRSGIDQCPPDVFARREPSKVCIVGAVVRLGKNFFEETRSN
jgi:hypothetical protein